MTNLPRVDIVILNYNAADDTVACVHSVENISYPNYEIVLVDNCSSDHSVQRLTAEFPDVVLLVSDHNWGYADGNNQGISYALNHGAAYVCLLNNDVIVEPNFLEPLVALLEDDDGIGVAGPCICEYQDRSVVQAMGANINLYTGLAQGKYKGTRYSRLEHRVLPVDYLGGACFIARAAVFKQVGLIPANYFLFYEETEFCLNVKRYGYKLVCLGRSRVYHKRSATIARFSGLSYFFLNRNRIVFMRRNANFFQKLVFTLYVMLEGILRLLLRGESTDLFRFYLAGLKADLNAIDFAQVTRFVNPNS
ncbi:MAG TPA: glycosyltransferase family 2 protein [Desulfobacteria bacterium]|nr:glycosyltransferase family 2 protein [Desulfobacteria bacterium]